MRDKAVIGIDVGGTKILVVLFDERFHPIDECKSKTPLDKGERGFSAVLRECVESLASRAKKKGLELAGAGVGCAGSIDYRSATVRNSPNLPFLRGYSFTKTLARKTIGEVLVGNDVQMGVYGEQQFGVAKGLKHVIGVFFGTGIGGAVIIDGKLHVGATGSAGEIGHYLVSAIGRLAGSERQGVLDAFLSRGAIAGEAAAVASKHLAPYLVEIAGANVKRIKATTLADSIKHGDKEIERLVRGRARTAGIVLANLVNFLDPEMVVLGGGLVEAMPTLFRREIERGIHEHATAPARKKIRVAVTRLEGRAVAAGAAKMAWDRFARSVA